MSRLVDRSGIPPTSRLAVARGTLDVVAADDAFAPARSAAITACKDTARLVPTVHLVHLTDAFLDIETSHETVVTMTVQAVARGPLGAWALCGAAAALVALRETTGRGVIKDLHVVQDVER